MATNTNASAKFDVKAAIAQFTATWEESVAKRIEACKIYADAIKNGNSKVRDDFQKIPRFHNWTQRQWRFVYLVGCEQIDPLLIDFKNISVPLALADHNVKPVVQRSIHRSGLEMYTIRGEKITVKFKDVKVGYIEQVFDGNGNQRSKEEQIKYLKDLQKDNIEIVSKGNVLIHHGCYLNKQDILSLITNPALGISISDIIEYKKGKR